MVSDKPATKSHDPFAVLHKFDWYRALFLIATRVASQKLVPVDTSDTMQITIVMDTTHVPPLPVVTCTWYSPEGTTIRQQTVTFDVPPGAPLHAN